MTILQMTFIWCDGMSESIFNTKKMKTSKAWLYIVFSLLVCVYLKKINKKFTIQLYLAIKGECNTFYACNVEGYTV